MVTIHSTRKGKCSLSGKDCEGVVASFEDGTFTEVFVSWQSLRQLVELRNHSLNKTEKANAKSGNTSSVQ
jgi:hypothetical protein